MTEKSENSGSNNRWWESYLVRYFLGFIIGSICIAIIGRFSELVPGSISLMNGAQHAIENESKYGVTAIVLTVALLGLAYCYIASTPITVLHAGRYSKGPVDRISRFFRLGWVSVLGILMLFPSLATSNFHAAEIIYEVLLFVSIVTISFSASRIFGEDKKYTTKAKGKTKGGKDKLADVSNVPAASTTPTTPVVPNDKNKKSHNIFILGFFISIWSFSQVVPMWFDAHHQISTIRLLAIGAPIIWIGLAQYLVLFKILNSPVDNYQFYTRLFSARQQAGARDVRDTYSHLREHSNAIFIVGVEISMLALIVGSIQLDQAANIVHTSPLDGMTFWLCALGIWIVPTIFMWSRANAMEKYFAENPSEFLTKDSSLG